MKVISLLQPWASLVAVGAKKIETRSWATKYRGPLAIHASKKWNLELASMLSIWQFQSGLAPLVGRQIDFTWKSWPGIEEKHLPRGAIIAVCRLVDCIPTDNLTLKQIDIERHFGDFSPGRYAWILEDVKPLPEPILAKGSLGLWEWQEMPEDGNGR